MLPLPGIAVTNVGVVAELKVSAYPQGGTCVVTLLTARFQVLAGLPIVYV